MRLIAFVFVFWVPLFLCAQDKESARLLESARRPSGIRSPSVVEVPNALTMQVIMAQRPAQIAPSQWKEIMIKPVNYSLYPIKITQGLLDTIDATQLDMRDQYIIVQE